VAAAGGARSGARPSDARTPGTPSPGTAPRHAGPTEPAAFRGPIGIPLDAAPRWTRAGEAEPSDAPDPDLALLLPTCDGSGTTRLVPLRETRALTGIDAAIRLDDGLVRRGDTVLALMPPESSLGLVFAYLMPLLVGASVRHFERRPAAPELRRRLEEHAPEVLFAGAEMIRAIARDPDLAPEHVASIRSAVCGGSRLEPRIVERLRERHALHVCTWYGSAETLLVSANRTEDNRGDTVGRPVAGVSVAILGTDGSPLPAGQTGEIAVAGPSVLSRRDGYFGEGDAAATATTTATATAAAVDGEPFRTGDLGSLDAAGFLRFEGRRKPIAKVDGASVDLLEVRRVLLHIPGVENVRLDIRSDEVHGQRIDARLTMREPAESSSLEAVAREQLSSHKVPHSLVAVAADESAPPAATPPAATPSAATPRERGGDGCAGPESAL